MQPFLKDQGHCNEESSFIMYLTNRPPGQALVILVKKMQTVYLSGWNLLPGRYFFLGLLFLISGHVLNAQCSRCEKDKVPPVLLNNFEVEAQYAKGGGPFGLMFKVNHARRFHRLTARVFGLSIGSYLGPETYSVPFMQARGFTSDTHLRGHASIKHQFRSLRFTYLEFGIYGGIYHFSNSGSFQQTTPLPESPSQNGKFRGDLGTRAACGTPFKYTKKRVYYLQLSFTNSWNSILGLQSQPGPISSQVGEKISFGIGLFVTQPFHVPSHFHGRSNHYIKPQSENPGFKSPI